MRKMITLCLVACMAAQASAGSFEDLVAGARKDVRASKEASDTLLEYSADGRLTIEAARRLSQGRSDYDMLVFAYVTASRTDEIAWDAPTLKAAKDQIGLCEHAQVNAELWDKQLEKQMREISGDRVTAEALKRQYTEARQTVWSRRNYACRGVKEIRNDYQAAASRVAAPDALFDR